MVIMDVYYPPDRLQEIWRNIDHLHLSYLEMEESPEKLEHRIKLEDCIREFLCIAAHSQKFFFRETSDILHRSAASKKDFSGYKAATGWNTIQLYAGNLLSQPWRKEYKLVKTYCGFYKHQIEANLVGAEIMFEAMGYKHNSNGVLILDGPICPDTVTNVSKDCLIAYVECQIMKAIWEEIAVSFEISWLEVLDFRKNHLCSPEQSIRALTYQYHQKQYQAQNINACNGRSSQKLPGIVYPPLPSHTHQSVQSIQPAPYLYGTNSCSLYAHTPYTVPVQYSTVAKPYTNGYCCTNSFVGQPPAIYGYTVPTGQLIDLDLRQPPDYVVDGPSSTSIRPSRSSLSNQDSKKNIDVKEQDKNNSQLDDWEYVYRNLRSQGYSKDLGERGDILNIPVNYRKAKPTNIDNALHHLTVADRPLKVSEAMEEYSNITNNKGVEKIQSDNSSYDNLSDTRKPSTSKTPNKIKLKEKVTANNNTAVAAVKTLDTSKWECKACTYHNNAGKDICEMCSKSKVNVEQQMEIGGPQCSKCTLVNAKDMKTCQACGASLKDSPTYI